ncbi:DMT family transporter, partial [uncultured Megasphaera sp.]|uniref:DMT family transporter n=1 Tax=uncultured Megasphaera sp. TaxID=165188 RepID=UPI00260A17FA
MMKKSRSRILWGCLCAVGCETLFGLSYICTKEATQAASALTLLGWRFFVAAAFMALCAASGRMQMRWKGKPRKPLLAVALCNPVVYFVAETVGISRTTASESGAFLACIPAVSLLASTLLLDKSPQKHQVVGIAVTLAGVLTAVLAAGASASFS